MTRRVNAHLKVVLVRRWIWLNSGWADPLGGIEWLGWWGDKWDPNRLGPRRLRHIALGDQDSPIGVPNLHGEGGIGPGLDSGRVVTGGRRQ